MSSNVPIINIIEFGQAKGSKRQVRFWNLTRINLTDSRINITKNSLCNAA
jgi:hypothetical protein